MKHIRKNWRRFAAVLLSAALMISTVSQTAFAAGADTGKAIQLVDGGTAANISGGQASRSNGEAGPSVRSGQVRAYWMGRRISADPS